MFSYAPIERIQPLASASSIEFIGEPLWEPKHDFEKCLLN